MKRWTCPYCKHAQILGKNEEDYSSVSGLSHESTLGPICFVIHSIACANPECKQLSLAFELRKFGGRVAANNGRPLTMLTDRIRVWRLLPSSHAKPQPDYIPSNIVEDYNEACGIVNLSPKASATLARRCLQGMIRNFCGISLRTLGAEITALRKAVDEGRAPKGVQDDTVEAIDAIRRIGRHGAHMEMDTDIIVDIDPGEAEALIAIIEMLFEEWYVARHDRAERIAKAVGIAAAKKAEQQGAAAAPTEEA